MVVAQPAAELVTGYIRQVDVQEEDVGSLPLHKVERLATIRSLSCLIALLREGCREHLADHRIVVDHKHSTARPPER